MQSFPDFNKSLEKSVLHILIQVSPPKTFYICYYAQKHILCQKCEFYEMLRKIMLN